MPARELWRPAHPELTQMHLFKGHIAIKYKLELPEYEALQQWSVENIAEFWSEVWDWGDGVVASERWTEIIDLSAPMPSIPPWFSGAKLNWAENMLSAGMKTPEKVAVVECAEPPLNSPLVYNRTTFGELYALVHTLSLSLRSLGLQPGAILVYYGPNSLHALALLLATTSIGAIWSSAASDFGAAGVLERFEQFLPPTNGAEVDPRQKGELWGIVGVESVRYNGKVLPQREKLVTVVEGLEKARKERGITTKFEVVVADYLGEGLKGGDESLKEGWKTWDALLKAGADEKTRSASSEIEFWQAGFDHPLWVLFSSGTTGKPKPIVHRAGGMLLQSKKEHALHGDMGPQDVFMQYTTVGWMMYNYLVSGLQTGATLVLFDGSPLFRPELLWQMVDDLGITVFGTSAKYLDVLSKGYDPVAKHSLSSLKQVLSTGSPLKPELFVWAYEHIKKDLLLGSITGGTDICSLFAGHNAMLPVYEGEIQCICLGMAIASFSEEGAALPADSQGDLVCTKSFPCMPAFFWGDEGGKRYHASYFDKFDGVWAHGDFCIITGSQAGNGGGLLMLGRSDGVLNPSGIRFGSSELYEVLDTFSPSAAVLNGASPSLNIIEDSLVVGQKTLDGADERVVLFVKLVDDEVLGDELLKEIKTRIRSTRSARHVPERILPVSDIPHTVNGKKVEVPIKKLLNGASLASINAETLRNPECLEEYVKLGALLRMELETRK